MYNIVTKEEFLIRLSKILPTIKLVEEYKNTTTKIIVRDNLGIEYLSSPYKLLYGMVPSIKTALDKNIYFKLKSSNIFSNKYDYSLVKYESSKKNVIIICPIHGEFSQRPSRHLQGKGCLKCSQESQTGGWKYSKWNEKGLISKKFKSFKLYIIKCWDKEEQFYKIGKTFLNIKERFHSKKRMPYNWEIITLIEGNSNEINKLEAALHNSNKEFKYLPKITFNGKTECYYEIRIQERDLIRKGLYKQSFKKLN